MVRRMPRNRLLKRVSASPARSRSSAARAARARAWRGSGQFQRELHQLGQHRGLVLGRRRRGQRLVSSPTQLDRGGTADGEEEAAETGFGLAGAIEIAGREGAARLWA